MTVKEKIDRHFEYGQFMTDREIIRHEEWLKNLQRRRKERMNMLMKTFYGGLNPTEIATDEAGN